MCTKKDVSISYSFSATDRAANYGDGVFTTMSVSGGKVALYHRHCQRIIRDANRLGIQLNDHDVALRIAQEARILGEGVLKLLVSAGEGGRGYARPEMLKPQLHFSTAAHPPQYAKQQQHGVTMGCASLSLALQPALAGIKHLNRLEQVLIKRELTHQQVQDLVVMDATGNVAEASAANLFWSHQGKWFTPSLESCGVHGVMRQFLIDWMTRHGEGVESGNFPLSTLVQADSVLLCNALMPVLPVRSLVTEAQTTQYSLSPVHELIHAFQKSYKEEYAPAN